NHCIFNTGLDNSNIDEFITLVADQFITLLDSSLPDDFFGLCSCPKCGYIGSSVIETIDKPWMPDKVYRAIYNKAQTCRATCSKCNQPYPLAMADYKGRVMYFESKC
ncbi:hypothetical protein A9Q81_22180, partial [Gammaproteobacteria bacterium 42_54_T18]